MDTDPIENAIEGILGASNARERLVVFRVMGSFFEFLYLFKRVIDLISSPYREP